MSGQRLHRRNFATALGAWGAVIFGALSLLPGPANASLLVFRGKVVMEDGSPPGRLVGIQRTCTGMDHSLRETNAAPKTGQYVLRLDVGDFGGVFSGGVYSIGMLPCVLEAVVEGFRSSQIDLTDPRITNNSTLPNITLTHVQPGTIFDANTAIPRAASKPWAQALKFIAASDWAAAEKALRAVVEAAPDFAPGWAALGAACGNQQKIEDARPALERAVRLDPKRLPPYLMLSEALIGLHDWEAAAKASQALIDGDTKHRYLDAFLNNALARYELNDLDGALHDVNEVLRLDKYKDYPRAEYIQGLILEARNEYAAATEHMRKSLQQYSHAKDAPIVLERIANMGKADSVDLAAAMRAADMRLPAAGEAPVPGGIRAFAAIARLKETPSPADFFLQYCRAITEGSGREPNPTLEAREAVRAFMNSVSGLESLGERKGDTTLVR